MLTCVANTDIISWGFTIAQTFADGDSAYTIDDGDTWYNSGQNLAFTIPITCSGGGGDPHFFGFRGIVFDFRDL